MITKTFTQIISFDDYNKRLKEGDIYQSQILGEMINYRVIKTEDIDPFYTGRTYVGRQLVTFNNG